MIVNKFFNYKLWFVVKSELRPTQKLYTLTRSFNNKCSYNSLGISLNKLQNRVTSVGSTTHCVSLFNKENNLFRTMSDQSNKNLTVNYDDIVKAQGDSNLLIIDVREDSEIQETGKLPGSIHIPMGNVTNVLTNLSNEEFEQQYSRKKPSKESKIILSCRSGRRSEMVQADILKLGYKNSYNYSGGWLDWESKQKT